MKVYKIRVSILDIRPPIWRRLIVPSDITFDKLHEIIQISFGWGNSHLYGFDINEMYIGLPDDSGFGYDPDRSSLEEKIDFHLKKGKKFTYTYDYGDNWEHKIEVEDILEEEAGKKYPVCIKGKRRCPPEDIGGVWGYEDFLYALSNPKSENYESYREWMDLREDESYDSEYFSLQEINESLEKFL